MNTNKKKILLISNDNTFVNNTNTNLKLSGYESVISNSYENALPVLEKKDIDVVFIDFENMPLHEMDLVSYIKTQSPHTEIAVLTTINEIDNATLALRNGASLYLLKPVNYKDFKSVLNRLETKAENSKKYHELEIRLLNDLMGSNEAIKKILNLALKIAPTTSTVLLGGESGTGKEFFAKIIHRSSQRSNGNFVAMNCGAIPDALFESELFGHKKGSFTGADRDKIGLVEEAHMGTLFLDEVAELSPTAQVKLLRFLQERTFRRIGETNTRTVNTRIIAATNKDIPTLIKNGEFREDLYYRLNVFYLHLPPLRERKETLPNLIRLFVQKQNSILGKNVNDISKPAEIILANYDYPGNIRELENIIEHAMVLADDNIITESCLPEFMFQNRLMLNAPNKQIKDLKESSSSENIQTLANLEKEHIRKALDLFNNNYTEVAKQLGISRSTLWRKIKSYNLEKS